MSVTDEDRMVENVFAWIKYLKISALQHQSYEGPIAYSHLGDKTVNELPHWPQMGVKTQNPIESNNL